jgi:hypothetical protein
VRVHSVAVPAKLIAVAHGDAHGLAFNREVELAAAAGGAWSWGLLRLRVLRTMPRAQGYRKPIADQSALRPANFTTLPHFSVSSVPSA